MPRKSKKAALSQGGFLLERGCENQRHWAIMHEPDGTASDAVRQNHNASRWCTEPHEVGERGGSNFSKGRPEGN